MGKQRDGGISWTDYTFNPWWGCVNVSPACDHCYAETFSKRTGNLVWGKDAPRRFFGDKHWAEPLKWNGAAAKEGVRRRVFCGSMCDVMEDRADLQEYRERLYALIEATPHLDWLLLTKRPQNYRRFLPRAWLESTRPNVWGMTTVESLEYVWRAKELASTPFAVRGLSVEPLLADLNLADVKCSDGKSIWNLLNGVFSNVEDVTNDGKQHLTMTVETKAKIHWVICGGESGPGARPMHPNWARSLRDQCVAAGVPFFFKQHGDWLPIEAKPNSTEWSHGEALITTTHDIRGMESLTDETTHLMRRVGKKSAGALLDGQEWKQFPEARA